MMRVSWKSCAAAVQTAAVEILAAAAMTAAVGALAAAAVMGPTALLRFAAAEMAYALSIAGPAYVFSMQKFM